MKITIKSKKAGMETIELQAGQGSWTIGRDPSCDVVLDSTQVSTVHARLHLDSKGLSVTDAGSINGIYVDEKRLGSGPFRLAPGMEFVIAEFGLKVDDFDAPAAGLQGKRRMLLAILLLLVFSGGALFLFKSADKPAQDTPAQEDLPEPEEPQEVQPVFTPEQLTAITEAGNLVAKGEKALYEENDSIKAAGYFNKALELNPRDARAGNYLKMLQTTLLEEMLERGARCLQLDDMKGAKNVLKKLETLAPENKDVKQFRKIMDGIHGYQKARGLIAHEDWPGAISILENIVIPDDFNRVRLLKEAKRQAGLLDELEQAKKTLGEKKYEAALESFRSIMARADLGSKVTKEAQSFSDLTEAVVEFKKSDSDPEHPLKTINTGNAILADHRIKDFPGMADDIKQALDKLRSGLAGKTDLFTKEFDEKKAAALEAEEAGRRAEAARNAKSAFDAALILDFIDPANINAVEMEKLRGKIAEFARQAFGRAYVLKEKGDHNEALENFELVIEIASPYDDIYSRALAASDDLQSQIKGRPAADAAVKAAQDSDIAAPAPPDQDTAPDDKPEPPAQAGPDDTASDDPLVPFVTTGD